MNGSDTLGEELSNTDYILVVEDDEATREGLVDVLSDHGFATRAVANGREALDTLAVSPPPCVILLDVMMPVMNGVEFRQRQLQDPALANIPVVIVSAAAHAKSIDASAFVPKPLDVRRLVDTVRAYC